MKYECDCGATYSHVAGVEACQINNHGQPHAAVQVHVVLGFRNDCAPEVIGVYAHEGHAHTAGKLWCERMEGEFPGELIDCEIESTFIKAQP